MALLFLLISNVKLNWIVLASLEDKIGELRSRF
jgi:hypothetical protein